MNSVLDAFIGSTFTNKDLFDKIINVTFKSHGVDSVELPWRTVQSTSNTVEKVFCPSKGPKPQISIKGNIILSPVITDLQLRFTNLRLSRPLSDYKSVEIVAGYGNSLTQAFSGTVQYAYQETPGPDGVTAFLFFPTFLYNEWINKPFVKPAYAANTLVSTILTDICAELKNDDGETCIQNFQFDQTMTVGPAGFNQQGAIKDVTLKLCSSFGLLFRLEGKTLTVFGNKGTTRTHGINVLSSAPRKDAAGWSVTAPWDPAIRPGDEIWFDPAYARSSFGGFITSKNPQFIAISIEIEFSTVLPENTMRIVMVEKDFFLSGKVK